MSNFKIKDSTREKLDEINEEEHSSYGSVTKSLIEEYENTNK